MVRIVALVMHHPFANIYAGVNVVVRPMHTKTHNAWKMLHANVDSIIAC